ncbi:MAG: dependent oxidoreductase [Microbacteriaceae bacterium]|jgi:glycine/D-amino acid oxidase-like deaminating enzyme|nr:dependent oxidoreductase [Microbacteriaceae bacterium]
MTSLPARPRVAVIGAGILGVSTALELARLGADVTLVTEGSVASQASGRSLSWLNSSRKRSSTYHALRVLGIDRYRTLAWAHPGADWLRFDGGLTWDAGGDGNGIADAFAHERSLGYDARLLAAEDIAGVTPGVDASLVTPEGAIFNPGEGWVDLPSLIRVLLEEYAAAGGTLLVDAGKAAIDVEDGRVTGVSTAAGADIEVDAAVLAAGAAVPSIVAELGVHIGDASPIALLVKTKPGDFALRAVLNTPRVAVRPTPDGALVLDSAWSEEEVVVRDDGGYEIADTTVAGLLAEASAVLEGNPELELESYGVGPKPIPGDGEPVFGELEGITGYFVAFSHSGATLGLIAGELIASEVVSGQRHPLLADFRPARFQVPARI